MRLRVAFLVLAISTPAYAQAVATTPGAMSVVSISDPPNNASVTNRVVTPPTVIAPGLAAAGIETCLGSASGGLSVMGGGVTFGSTKVDEGCTIRLLSRQLFAFGFKSAALALMCQDKRVAVAMAVTGTPCPAPPAAVKPDDEFSFLPPLAFTQEEQPAALPEEAQAQPSADEPEVKPFTAEEDALFRRETGIH
jgi:hypothetical protein